MNRILSAEHYIKLSENKELNKEFAKMLVFHFENLMLGVGDTPVFNSDTNTLNDDFLKSYKYYISKNGVFKSDLQKYIEKRKLQDKDFAENFDKGYEEFKINELKNFNISEYLDNKEIRDEYLAQVLKDGDKDEILEALVNIEKAKT